VKPVAQSEVVITHEDVDRAHDRARVSKARARRGFSSGARLLWLLAGPGVLVMLGENDGPSMLAYAATGAKFGIGFFLPFVVLTFCMAIVVQEMTVRLGAATHRGHAELIFDRFGPFWGWFSMIDLGIGNFLTLITEFIAVRAGLGFFGVRPWVAILIALVILYAALMSHRYWTWERITLAAAAFNLIFIPVAFMTHPHWHSVGHSLITWHPLPGFNKDTLLIVLADIGATVTPWMLFFQQSATVDKGMTTKDIRFGRIDTVLGAALASAAAVATILATAPLFAHKMSADNFQAAEFAQALQPIIGRFGASLFALGMVEAGIVAAITISTSSAYAFGEVARKPHSLNLPMSEGRSFYGVLALCALAAAAIVLIPGLPLVYVVLLVNVVAVLAMPPALVFLYMLVNDREIMGDLVSPLWASILSKGIVIVLTATGVLYGVSIIAPNIFAALGGK
jgi:Mn2+/Fe2+ NRAMP family transporter